MGTGDHTGGILGPGRSQVIGFDIYANPCRSFCLANDWYCAMAGTYALFAFNSPLDSGNFVRHIAWCWYIYAAGLLYSGFTPRLLIGWHLSRRSLACRL